MRIAWLVALLLLGCSSAPPPAPSLGLHPRDADEARELTRRCGLCDAGACRTIADYFDATARGDAADFYAGRACGCAACGESDPAFVAYCHARAACP